jgi:hypothetical protein
MGMDWTRGIGQTGCDLFNRPTTTPTHSAILNTTGSIWTTRWVLIETTNSVPAVGWASDFKHQSRGVRALVPSSAAECEKEKQVVPVIITGFNMHW